MDDYVQKLMDGFERADPHRYGRLRKYGTELRDAVESVDSEHFKWKEVYDEDTGIPWNEFAIGLSALAVIEVLRRYSSDPNIYDRSSYRPELLNDILEYIGSDSDDDEPDEGPISGRYNRFKQENPEAGFGEFVDQRLQPEQARDILGEIRESLSHD